MPFTCPGFIPYLRCLWLTISLLFHAFCFAGLGSLELSIISLESSFLKVSFVIWHTLTTSATIGSCEYVYLVGYYQYFSSAPVAPKFIHTNTMEMTQTKKNQKYYVEVCRSAELTFVQSFQLDRSIYYLRPTGRNCTGCCQILAFHIL